METNVEWISGKDDMTKYTFGQERVGHYFCGTCGTSMGAKSTDPNFFSANRAVNIRTLKGVDIDSVKLRKVDGRNR